MNSKSKPKKIVSDVVSKREAIFALGGDEALQHRAKPLVKKPRIRDDKAELFEEVWGDTQSPEADLHLPVKREKKVFGTELKAFAVVALTVVVIFQAAHILASGLDAKNNVVTLASEGLSNLKEAQVLTEQKDFSGAQNTLESARKNFLSAQQDLKDLGVFTNTIMGLTGKGRSAQSIVDAGQAIAEAGINLNNFYAIALQIKATPEGLSAPDGTYEALNGAQLYLKKVNADLDRADKDFESVDPSILPADMKVQFEQYSSLLKTSVLGLGQITDGISLLQTFLTPGQKNILILFENNNELRATGGFIGTYGYFKLNNGKITSQKISSIYDLDGQLKEYVAPPGPYQIMTDRWGLRDSNYFVDFKTSAQKAIVFYEKEGMETPDAVLAFTPDVFIDLLKITGPVYLPKYNLTLASDNFRNEVQANTSGSQGEKNPKQMLSDFAPLFLQKLSSVPDESRKDLIPALLSNLAQKNILIYDRNPKVQNKIENYNWGGRIADTDRDYLAVYNTNIGGKKTDVNIEQKLDISSEVQADDSIINTVTYTRAHNLNSNESDTNVDYVRFLVPYGSELLSAHGFDPKQYMKSDASNLNQNVHYTIDNDLALIDQNAKIDASTSTVITREAGKTVFANWIETAPGDVSIVTIKYRLPFKADESRKFSFILQKQPGNNPISYSWKMVPKYPVLWYTPLDLSVGSNKIQYEGTLSSDLFIGAVLDNQK